MIFNSAKVHPYIACVLRKTFIIIFGVYFIFQNTLINISGSHEIFENLMLTYPKNQNGKVMNVSGAR